MVENAVNAFFLSRTPCRTNLLDTPSNFIRALIVAQQSWVLRARPFPSASLREKITHSHRKSMRKIELAGRFFRGPPFPLMTVCINHQTLRL